jgi:ankyrin repeat protein
MVLTADTPFVTIAVYTTQNSFVDPDSKDNDGRTPLSWAAAKE